MLAMTLAFSAGIFCLLQCMTLPPVWILFVLIPVGIVCLFFRFFRFVSLFIFGLCWAWFQGSLYLNQTLPERLENRDLLISGVVSNVAAIYPEHVRFRFKLLGIKEPKEVVWQKETPTIVLSWYKTKRVPKPGEVWQLRVRLKRPYGFMNLGSFDYEGWSMRKKIHAFGYVKKDINNQFLDRSPYYFFQNFRFSVAEKIKKIVPVRLYGLVLALSLGERSQISVKQRDTLTKTGTSHLIAISGLHLGFVAGIFFLISRFFWSRFHYLTQFVSAPTFASGFSFVSAFFYAAMADFSLPTQRALIMIGVFLLARFFIYRIMYSHVIAIAVLLILLFDPFSIIAADFWLSFGAVGFILYVTCYRKKGRNKLMEWGRIQCCLSLALCPLLIFWFNQFPLYSLLANFMAVPVTGFVVVPLMLFAMIFLFIPVVSAFLYTIVLIIIDTMWPYLDFLAQQKYSVIPLGNTDLWAIWFAIMGIFILFLPRGIPGRWSGLAWLLPLFFPIVNKPGKTEFDLTLLDVGQGLSAIVQTRNHVLVYDTGARFSARFNIGDAVLVPFLRKHGVKQISILLISHGDNDHVGGVGAILKQYDTLRVLSSVPEKLAAPKKEQCYAGQHWQWDGVQFEILHPSLNRFRSENNNSCVLKISGAKGTLLLTGDIEKEAERVLLKHTPEKIKADVLVVPHHGSKTSSTLAFISAVSPKYALFSAGYKNRFGFPKQDILSRYQDRNIDTRVSYKTGALSVNFRRSGLEIKEYRTEKRRFWHYYF